MKTQIMFGVVALLFLASMSFVLAEENETPISYGNDSVENVSELADDSSVVSVNESSENESEDNTEIEVELEMNESASNMDVLGQQIKIWFTFNKEKKIDAELKLARLRLIQANIAAKNNHSAAMEKALEAHERILNRVKERITKLDDRSDLKNLNNSAVKLLAMERAIEVHQLRVDHLQNVLANANLTEKQREVLEMRLEKAQNGTAHLIEVSEEKKDTIKARLMAEGNLTEEEAEDLIEEKQERFEQERERIKDRIESIREAEQQRIEDLRENIRGGSERCSQKIVTSGACKKLMVGYEYDSETQKCIEKKVGGCDLKTPFKTLAGCQVSCEGLVAGIEDESENESEED
jgi:hypothetical protein